MSKFKSGAKSLFKIAENKVKGVDQSVPKHIAESRLATCLKCPKYFEPTGQCKECLCFLNFKTKIAQESCPLGKWNEYKKDN